MSIIRDVIINIIVIQNQFTVQGCQFYSGKIASSIEIINYHKSVNWRRLLVNINGQSMIIK